MEDVQTVSKKIWQAMQQEDSDTLKDLIHQDAAFVHMGATMSRDAEIDVILKRGIVYKTVEYQEVAIHEFDVTSILLNKLKLTAVVGGNEVTNPFVVTEVYTRVDDRLKLASMSYTRIMY